MMKKKLLLIIAISLSTVSFGQELKEYEDLIKLDEDYELVDPNVNELTDLDLSKLWKNDSTLGQFGFIGSNYRRLQIKFNCLSLSVKYKVITLLHEY